jgi:hypothetical protein
MRTIETSQDASGNIEYWGKSTALGTYIIKRFFYDSSDNLIRIVEGQQGAWDNRENLNWS